MLNKEVTYARSLHQSPASIEAVFKKTAENTKIMQDKYQGITNSVNLSQITSGSPMWEILNINDHVVGLSRLNATWLYEDWNDSNK